jgi:hypothetical protein
MKALAQIVPETSTANHGFILESLVGLETVNIIHGKLPIYHGLSIGIDPLLTHEGQKRQMVGELALVTRKSSGHKMKASLTDLV